jgi:hypothetical protein
MKKYFGFGAFETKNLQPSVKKHAVFSLSGQARVSRDG